MVIHHEYFLPSVQFLIAKNGVVKFCISLFPDKSGIIKKKKKKREREIELFFDVDLTFIYI